MRLSSGIAANIGICQEGIFFGASARDVTSRLLLHEDEQFKGVIFNCIKSDEVRPFVNELASHCNMRRRRTSTNESKIILPIWNALRRSGITEKLIANFK